MLLLKIPNRTKQKYRYYPIVLNDIFRYRDMNIKWTQNIGNNYEFKRLSFTANPTKQWQGNQALFILKEFNFH
jgi:hypothetical protein